MMTPDRRDRLDQTIAELAAAAPSSREDAKPTLGPALNIVLAEVRDPTDESPSNMLAELFRIRLAD